MFAFQRLIVVSLLLAGLLMSSSDAKPPAHAKTPLALIKINQYYVLYTCPITPRLDKSGTFIVGAEAIALMLNAKFTQNPQGTAVTMTKNGHGVRFMVGAKTALVDGKAIALPVASHFNSQTRQMLVPLSPLVNAFHIRSIWSKKRNTLTLTGKTLMIFGPSDDFDFISWENPGPDTQSLLPVALSPVSPLPLPKDGFRAGFLDLTVKNVSNRTIPKDYAYSNLMIADKFPATVMQGEISYSVKGIPFPPDIADPSPPLKPGGTRRPSASITFPPFRGYTLYVAAWLVVRKGP